MNDVLMPIVVPFVLFFREKKLIVLLPVPSRMVASSGLLRLGVGSCRKRTRVWNSVSYQIRI